MRSWLTAGIGLILVIGFVVSQVMQGGTPQVSGPSSPGADAIAVHQRLATQFLDLLDAGAYQDALVMAAPEVAAALGDGKIRMIWEGLPARLGPRLARGEFRQIRQDGRTVLGSRLQFRDQAMDVQMYLNERNLIAGFQLQPVNAASR